MAYSFRRTFFAGLVVIVPVGLTVYFLWLFFLLMSQWLAPLVSTQHWIPLHHVLVRPLSFFLTLFLIWLLGLFASNFIGRRLVQWLEKGIHQVPFFRGLYDAIQKLAEAFFGVNPVYQSVVLVEYPRKGVYTFGFVTSHIPGAVFASAEPHVCIFIPTVPNPTSGLLLYIPQSEVIPLSLSIEEVAKILVSHGVVPITESARRPGDPKKGTMTHV